MRTSTVIKNVVLIILLASTGVSAQKSGLITWWQFDEESGDTITGMYDTTMGSFKYVDGVIGSCMKFDGFTTYVRREIPYVPQLDGSFTVEAWIAPQTYSWNWTAIVDHQMDQRAGYFFGINAMGQVGLHMAIEGEWRKCISDQKISLLKWSHIVGVYLRGKGIFIYINGKEAGRLLTAGSMTPVGNAVYTPEGKLLPQRKNTLELWIGKSHQKMYPYGTEREPARKSLSNMIFDGLIDEVKLYSRALDDEEIQTSYKEVKLNKAQPLTWRKFPSGSDRSGEFGAYYTKMVYCDEWESPRRTGEYSDIVVTFDESPVKVVFWRGTNYGASYVTENGLWMGDQSIELWSGKSGWGSSEHMADKQTRYSHVRLIENNDARVVVHWRYAITNILYDITGVNPETGWGSWADEYFTIYPDRVVLRKQVLWANENDHQWQETIFFNQPGTRPEDNIEMEALTLANMKGESFTYSWEEGAPSPYDKPADANIQRINLKAKNKPFIIFEPGSKILEFPWGIRKEWSHFPWWNHWPVGQIPNDGRNASGIDRPSHSAIAEGHPLVVKGKGDSYLAVSLYGLSEKRADQLLPLAKSWIQPPQIKDLGSGYNYEGYDKYQRAYILECEDEGDPSRLAFELAGSQDHPIVNPAFLIRGWGRSDVSLKMNDIQIQRGKSFRFGHRRTPAERDLIVWIERESDTPVDFVLFPVKIVF